MKRSSRIAPGPGQESVWDYPRPPRVEPAASRIRVVFNGTVIADTRRAQRVLETSHPPVYYIPREDIRIEFLVPGAGGSMCEWKGKADYYSVAVGNKREEDAAWTYPEPKNGFSSIRDHIAFYPSKMDECYVGDEAAAAQPGGFYGGWITSDIVGPFKGEPGSWGW